MRIEPEKIAESFVSSLPEIYLQLQEALKKGNPSFPDLEKIIIKDPGLTARLLRMVNSSFYGFKTEIKTIAHALSIIGSQKLTEVAEALVYSLKLGTSGQPIVPPFKEGIFKTLEMEEKDLEEIKKLLDKNFQEFFEAVF
ncbi:hypothetical protein UR09_02715 [Candidatus Nitromaritima sp. SCGC AAA799-A02]|nr:hypothetical protein UR09_02715 [Candidatus Nitromaritima sp. SCGC AAA799-A02]